MSRENPVAAVFLSWAMVELFLLMGSLNQIAQLRELLMRMLAMILSQVFIS